MSVDERTRLLSMADALKRKVVGQDHAVDAICQSILAARAGMGDPERPYGVFLLLGPTGVGKTKLAKEVAGFLFGDKDEIVRLDMSEYEDRYTVSSLLGAPPGYLGFEEGREGHHCSTAMSDLNLGLDCRSRHHHIVRVAKPFRCSGLTVR